MCYCIMCCHLYNANDTQVACHKVSCTAPSKFNMQNQKQRPSTRAHELHGISQWRMLLSFEIYRQMALIVVLSQRHLPNLINMNCCAQNHTYWLMFFFVAILQSSKVKRQVSLYSCFLFENFRIAIHVIKFVVP